jgi:hypothetical protein
MSRTSSPQNPHRIAASNSLADASQTTGTVARCARCDERTFLLPLHGARGGPLCCPLCIGKFHAEHGKRRRHGRIVIRAMRAFLDNGGTTSDLDKLKQSAICGDFFGHEFLGHEVVIDPLGYLANAAANAKGEIIELTSELLADAIKLAHPDYHPPERQELARRTTQGLLALKPFTFPAPTPEPPPIPKRNGSTKFHRETSTEPSRPAYPCADCRDTIPYFYCDSCRAEWDKRRQEECDREATKQRKWYAQRKARRCQSKICATCGAKFKAGGGPGTKRNDARYCSDTCRQRAHRETVTAKNKSRGGPCFTRDTVPPPADAEVRS